MPSDALADRLETPLSSRSSVLQSGICIVCLPQRVRCRRPCLDRTCQATPVHGLRAKIILLLGLSRQQSALALQKTVTDATNEMMKQASEMMKTQAIEIEKQSQRGIIDIETLEKTNGDLVDTISGVLDVQEQGRRKRAEIEQRMAQLTDELKSAMSKSPT